MEGPVCLGIYVGRIMFSALISRASNGSPIGIQGPGQKESMLPSVSVEWPQTLPQHLGSIKIMQNLQFRERAHAECSKRDGGLRPSSPIKIMYLTCIHVCCTIFFASKASCPNIVINKPGVSQSGSLTFFVRAVPKCKYIVCCCVNTKRDIEAI